MSPSTPKSRANGSQTPGSGTSRSAPRHHNAPRGKSPSRGRAPARSPHAQPASAHTASTFAALGDRTRLSLLARLSHGPRSISQLTHGSRLTRQAITKHLRVLERARIVRSVRSGRHSFFELDPAPVLDLRDYLDRVSTEWDHALARLQSLVEH